ncbi:HpcH/HpaI aldolase/citrate lyase family protein [Kitasatospora purpeofusca]|uniref:HpcH/HpaI aldolase/citrate lyase family protein n=1 Tax=Kitasatospora purpeofusca TaxID=67352 RepID=UPI0036AEAF01
MSSINRIDGGGLPAARAGARDIGRTWLVTPACVPGWFEAALRSEAGVALLDLEDSVPHPRKEAARAAVLDFLAAAPRAAEPGAPVLGLRLNAADSVEGRLDLAAMARRNLWPDLVVVPKTETGDEVTAVVTAVHRAGAPTQVWALVESPRAILSLPGIVRTPGLAGVLFGAADYAVAAGCRITSRAMWYPRCQIVTAAAAAGIPAVDTPYFRLDDPDGLRQEALEAVELGFSGKVAVHPRQLPVIARAFMPGPGELEAARTVLAAADGAGGGITTADGAMVGPPVVEAARAVVRRAATTVPAPKASR